MSRFFHGGSDSDSDFSDDSDLRSEEDIEKSEDESEDENIAKPVTTTGPATGASMFKRGAIVESDEEDEDDVRRVVKSAKDKRFEEMRSIVHAIDNARKINDWVALQTGKLKKKRIHRF